MATQENQQDDEDRLYNTLSRDNSVENIPKFLFLFKIHNYAVKCCCDCTLRLGVQIISVFFIISAIYELIYTISQDDLQDAIISIVRFLVFIIAGLMLFLSVMNRSVAQAYIGYIIYTIILYLNLLEAIIVFIVILFGNKILRFGLKKVDYSVKFALIVGLIYLCFVLVVILIHIYLIFIVYSYIYQLENENYD